jgi:tetrahydromethanopterin S-methyltransferase subunit G
MLGARALVKIPSTGVLAAKNVLLVADIDQQLVQKFGRDFGLGLFLVVTVMLHLRYVR